MHAPQIAAWPVARQSVYLIGGRRLGVGSAEFAEAIAAAHATHQRPRCLCLIEGVEMYIARLAGQDGSFIVKRMPDTGCLHAPDCPSYEPPAELSGLGQVLGTAINEDPATGETTLNLGFSMSKIQGRSTTPAAAVASDSVASDGTKLSLRGLLHYLWDQAELTHWQPGFAGRRSWGTVRRHLLVAAQNKIARSGALGSRLYVPEVFSVEQRDAINARRVAQWATAFAAPGKPQQLMLLIGEVKEIVPARYGQKAVIKHVPDQAFLIDEQLYRRLGRRFERELSLWGSSDQLHMVMIATFGVTDAGLPALWEVCLMPVNGQWLPIEDSFEQQLVDKLVNEKRSFIKGLRYNVPRDRPLACAVLNDTGDLPATLWISTGELEAESAASVNIAPADGFQWTWHTRRGSATELPPRYVQTRSGKPHAEQRAHRESA